jgi:hypothetical protein
VLTEKNMGVVMAYFKHSDGESDKIVSLEPAATSSFNYCLCFRYVQPGGTKSSYKFVIPLHDCGTSPSGGFGRTVDNIIVIQTDDTVQVSVPECYRLTEHWHIT